MQKVVGHFAIILLGSLTLASPADAKTQVSLGEALRAAQNTVKVIQAQNAVAGVHSDIAGFTESEHFSWLAQSPAFTAGDLGLDESGAWSLTGTKGGLDTVTAKVYPDDLSVSWSKSLLPSPAVGRQLQEETLWYNLRSAESNLSDRLYQALINTYEGYRSAQLGFADLAISQKQAQLVAEEYARVLALSELGEATQKAVTKAKAERLRVEAQVKQTEADAAQTTNLLMVSLGLAAEATVESLKLDELRKQAAAVIGDETPVGYAANQVVAESMEISLLKEQVRLKELALANAEADSPWSVGVSIGAGLSLETQEPRWEVQARAVTYDLSGSARRQRAIAQAQQELDLASRLLTEAENQVNQDYQMAVSNLGYQRSLLQAAIWEWEAAQADHQVSKEQRRVGAISDHDLAKAGLTVDQAQLAVVRAHLAYEVQRYTVLALQGEQPLLALVKGESENEG